MAIKISGSIYLLRLNFPKLVVFISWEMINKTLIFDKVKLLFRNIFKANLTSRHKRGGWIKNLSEVIMKERIFSILKKTKSPA